MLQHNQSQQQQWEQLPACRMSRARDSWSAVNSAQTLPDWENKSKWKMKKTLLQALKTLKTPCLFAMKNRAGVNVWPDVAAAPLPSSGWSIAHSAWSSHDSLHTDASRLCETLVFAHQGQRCRSNQEAATIKRTKGGTDMSGIHEANAGGNATALFLP